MGWIVGIITFFIVLVALIKAPKETLGCLGIIVLAVVAFVYFFIIAPEQKRNRLNNQIKIAVRYDLKTCSQEYPLAIYIENNSNKKLKRVSWDIDIFRPGYSTNLAGYDNDYSSDKILSPGERWSACYRLPPTLENKGADSSSLEYKISGKYGTFE